ncbi:LOW QUALITY PROTEIN: hypothetical protein Ct61P_02796 [Colletotrichum tofieldiae]|nr:LOW QUALITY PROTEIN: hypothetical protein Ct61P_02796 [Colletotrichum tofieldiae]
MPITSIDNSTTPPPPTIPARRPARRPAVHHRGPENSRPDRLAHSNNASGVPIEVQTHYPTPATVDAESTTSAALDLSIAAVPSPSSTGGSTSESVGTSSDATLSTPAATTPSSTDPSTRYFPDVRSFIHDTGALGTGAVALPIVEWPVELNNFLSSQLLSSGTTSVTSSILSSLSSTWDSTSDSTSTSSSSGPGTSTFATSASATLDPTTTGDGTAGVVDGGGAAQPTSTPTATADGSATDSASTPTATVVGSVVGSLAGAAFLVVLVFLALRWKKRSGGRLRLSEASMGKRGILTGSGGPEGGSGGGMIQRSLSYGPTAAAAGAGAAAVAHKPSSRRASEPSETGERGFVRVAGRKLPSVLQAGGDGYTDPREGAAGATGVGGAAGTANDDESVYYRDSQAFFDPGGPGGQTPRLALGSPMRPVSGVVVLKESPARTPVTESAPFADPNASLSPLHPPARDPIGRTLPSQDGSRGSRGSASRFHEDM